MWKNECALFNELARACGSRFMAVNYIAKQTRKLAANLPQFTLESAVITWALTGQLPEVLKLYADRPSPEDNYVSEELSYIDDTRIKEEVSRLYKKSVRSHHLVYDCDSSFNEGEQSRIRVILRMLWYNFRS